MYDFVKLWPSCDFDPSPHLYVRKKQNKKLIIYFLPALLLVFTISGMNIFISPP